MQTSGSRATFRFGAFELDLAVYELRRLGRRVRLGRQPMDLLILLVQRRRELVSRGEIVELLWGHGVFVDVDTGINTVIRRVRRALRDASDAPEFVETVAGKGYRFIANVADNSTAQANRSYAATSARVWNTSVALAVLPFEDLGNDPERAYLAAGLTDEASASLAQIDPEHLSIKGRTHRYKGTTKTVGEIAQELSVDYLVQGSIRAEGPRLRVTVTLIRITDQKHVWSQSYEREPASLLGFQQELSAAIAREIRLTLSPDRRRGIECRQTQDAEAYDAYLRGRYQAHRRTAEGNARAIEHFNRAIAIDEHYALAWSDLAVAFAASAINADARPAQVGPPARAAALRAVRANPELSEAQLALGYGLWLLDWDWKKANAALRLAVDLDPSSVAAARIFGHALSQSGRHHEAETAMRRMRELEPLDALSNALSSQVAFQAHDLGAAADFARRAIALDPRFWIGYVELGQAYAALEDYELAVGLLTDATRLSGGNSKAISLRGYVLAKMGESERAREVLGSLQAASAHRYVPSYAMALVSAGLGETETMFDALARAFDDRDVHLMYLPVDMKWDPYRTDPRFVHLLDRCGFTA